MRRILDDFRFGVCLMSKSPGVAATAVLALALGIGANTAIFSVVYNVLLKPLPVDEPDKLFVFSHYNEQRKITSTNTPYPDVIDWRKQFRTVAELAAMTSAPMSLANGGEPERVFVGKVTESFLPLTGLGTVLGRNFLPDEDQHGNGRAVILSHALWERRFGRDPNVLGAQIMLDSDPYTVVGVLTQKFRWTGQPIDLLIPLAGNEIRGARPVTVVTAYGRTKPGVAPEQMQAEFDVATAATIARDPRYKGWRLKPGEITEWIVPDVRTSLWVLLGAVALVLLIACANVANLLLSRAAVRRREMAVRAALGAARRRLVLQLVAESTPLGVAGGAFGLILAWWCIRALPLLDASRIPRLAQTTIDPAVLAFTAAISVITCILFGLAPAVALSRGDLYGALKEGGRSATAGLKGRRLRGILVGAEVAIAFVLSIGAILMIRTFNALSAVDPGFHADHVLTGTVELPRPKLKSQDDAFAFHDAVLGRIRAMPGVVAAGMTNSLPLGGNYFRGQWQVQGKDEQPGDTLVLDQRIVDPEYFEALHIPLRRGRFFNAQDRKGAPPVVMLSESTARRLFPGEDPVGRRIGEPGEWMTVIGVTADVRHTDVAMQPGTELMLAFHQFPSAIMTFTIRLDPLMYPDPMRFAPLLRRAVAEVNKDQAVHRVASIETIMAERLAPRKLSMIVLIGFAALALILAAMGIYGVLAFAVEQRTHEIGLRMAVGARQTDVIRLVVREAVLLAAAGIAIGVLTAFGLTRLGRSILFGVQATDPGVFTATAALLLVVAAVASYVPARRATHVDPLVALRYE